jgi:5-methylcytosine-specific restriction endonuclease McrBC GTP-binding regulatory subunit McrB
MAKVQFQEGKIADRGAWDLIQFHPAYNYEDFVRGIRVETKENQIVYEKEHRVLSRMAKAAVEAPDKKFILIIDEINRANLAAVLGELIYALEYRGAAVRTPYEIDGDAKLVIPENFYVIGTMNTADRSIGHIDYAVRRRFAFVPLMPDRAVIERQHPQGVKECACTLFEAVEKLFNEGDHLAPDFHKDDVQVGHTYFLAKDLDTLFMQFAYQVYPLLREYYKDGILVRKGENPISLTINNEEFSIDHPVHPEDIVKALKGRFPIQHVGLQGAPSQRGSREPDPASTAAEESEASHT